MSLHTLFNPRSIAVIGASRTLGKIGYETFKNAIIHEYDGKVYAVNPNATEILGRKCYKSVQAIRGKIDLAIIVVPSQLVPQVLEDCGLKGIRHAVIISSGFLEADNIELTDRVLAIIKRYGMRVLGPNTMGFKNSVIGLDASFVYGLPEKGPIAVVSQSGALSVGVIHHANAEKLGLSMVIGTGNKIDIDDADLIEYLDEDEHTEVIVMYIEGVRNGRGFFEAAKACNKPIVAIKAGRTSAGKGAISTHTGSLAGDDNIYEGVFKQTKIIRARNVTELFDIANALAHQPLLRGNRIGIVSNGGGVGILLADEALENGLEVPELESATLKKLRRILPPLVIPRNPVDLVADASFYRYEYATKALLEDANIDGVIVTCVHGGYSRPGEYMGAVLKLVEEQRKHKIEKPLLSCWIGGREVKEVIVNLKTKNVPVYQDTTRAIKAMCALQYRGGMCRTG